MNRPKDVFPADLIWEKPPDVLSTRYVGEPPWDGNRMIILNFFEHGFVVLTAQATAQLIVHLACEVADDR